MTEAFNGLEWLKAEREALGKQIKQIELRLHAVQVLIDGVEENRRSNGHAPVPSIAPQVNGQRRPHILIATMREQGVNGLTGACRANAFVQ